MKKTIIYALLASATFSLTSCNDFLEQDPSDGNTVEKVYGSETDIKSRMTQIYSALTTDGLYGRTLLSYLKTNTDVELTSYTSEVSDANGSDIGCFDAKPTWGTLNTLWNNMYSAINNCNDFIKNVEASPLFSSTVADAPTEVQQMYGEVKVLRAMLYLDLIRTWGDVVYTTEPTTVDTDFFHTGTTDRNDILSALINELIEVEPMMKYAKDIDEHEERASREYCQALIGQLALYRGGYSLRPNEADASSVGVMKRADDYLDYYKIAVEYLGKVVNEGHHKLSQSYHDLWYNECNLKLVSGDDVIFEIPELKDYSGQLGYRIGVRVNAGDHAYGSASNEMSLSCLYIFSFDKRDLRRDETVVPYSYDADLKQQIAFSPKKAVSAFGIGKWSKLKMESPMGSNSTGNTGINSIRMRYADVLLMYAEALNEVNNGPTSEAVNALKTVRKRAFAAADQSEMVDQYVDSLKDKESFFNAIMDERKWEFGGEGIRKYDLARWNKYSEVVYNLYHSFQDWGRAASGAYVSGLDKVAETIYYRWKYDENGKEGNELEFSGFEPDEMGAGKPANDDKGTKWKEEAYATYWYALDTETGTWEYSDAVQWSFRGFINPTNEATVTKDTPVRYLCPYPSQVITDHRGYITQKYGY